MGQWGQSPVSHPASCGPACHGPACHDLRWPAPQLRILRNGTMGTVPTVPFQLAVQVIPSICGAESALTMNPMSPVEAPAAIWPL